MRCGHCGRRLPPVPVVAALAQLAHGDGVVPRPVYFENFLEPHETLVVLVDDREGLPRHVIQEGDQRL